MAKASAAASAMVESEGGSVGGTTTTTTTTTQLTGVLLRMDHVIGTIWHRAVYAFTPPNALGLKVSLTRHPPTPDLGATPCVSGIQAQHNNTTTW